MVCGGKPDASKLTEGQLEAFKALKRLTSLPIIEETVDESTGETDTSVVFETCPGYYYDHSTPTGADIKRIYTAMTWKKNGEFHVIEEPKHCMVQAVEIMEQSFEDAATHMKNKQAEETEQRFKDLQKQNTPDEVM